MDKKYDMRIAVCEDEDSEMERITGLLDEMAPECRVDVFRDGESFLAKFKRGSYDLLLLDIYMDEINGAEVMKQVRKVDEEVQAAFVTSSEEFALEGYRLHVARYIEKPVTAEALGELLDFAMSQMKPEPELTIGGESVALKKIEYIEQSVHQIEYHMDDHTTVTAKGKLDDILGQLDNKVFIRCHKSFVVNLNYVMEIDKELKVFHMQSGDNVYIRRSDFTACRKAYEDYLFESVRSM